MIKIAVITALIYEDKFLPTLFSSLELTDYPQEDWEIVMIDNKNSPITKKWFEDNVYPKVGKTLPKVTFIISDHNLGFAGGNNACIMAAQARGFEAVYLLNEDARGEAGFLKEAARRLEADKNIGAVQSFLILDPPEQGMNSIGNQFHYLGFSYCGGYKMPRHDAAGYLRVRSITDPSLNIATASGAALLLRTEALNKVGIFDGNYHSYHEDLDLSLRLREAGYGVVIEPASIVFHNYEFKRSAEKYYWMERNRYKFLLEHYKIPTLLILAPAFIASELGLIVFSAINGSFGSRLRAYGHILDMRNWSEIKKKRQQVQSLRKIGDRELLRSAVSDISFQETASPMMKIINPLMGAYWVVARFIIRW